MKIFFLLLTGLSLALGPGLRAQERPPESGFSCGLNAAYIYLNRAGHHVPYEDLRRDFSAEASPNSFLAIKKVLQAHGCYTKALRTDANYFLLNSGPAIVFLQLSGYSPQNENHFSYLASADRRTGVRLLDPTFTLYAASFISWDGFVRIYQGVALLPQ